LIRGGGGAGSPAETADISISAIFKPGLTKKSRCRKDNEETRKGSLG
jgi:hypothetical protein